MTPKEALLAPQRLQELIDGPRFGEIAGVLFDIRHPDLPLGDEWRAPGAGRPFGIAFPWDRFDRSEEEASGFVTDYRQGWPAVHVFAGDRLTARHVRRFAGRRGAGLDLEPDNARYFVDLCLTTEAGVEKHLDCAFEFTHELAIGPWSLHQRFSVDEDYADFLSSQAASWWKVREKARRGLTCLSMAWGEQVAKAIASSDELDEELAQTANWFEVQEYLDYVALVSFALGRAEAERVLLKPALEKHEGSMVRQRNLNKAVEARRRLGEPTREAAMQLLRRRPSLSLNACANAIAQESGRDPAGIRRVIASLFERGDDGRLRHTGKPDDPPESPAD